MLLATDCDQKFTKVDAKAHGHLVPASCSHSPSTSSAVHRIQTHLSDNQNVDNDHNSLPLSIARGFYIRTGTRALKSPHTPTMSSSRMYHASKLPIVSTVLLIWGNYELYRIHKGTHPYWSPKLEAAGIVRGRNNITSGSNQTVPQDAKVDMRDASGVSATSIKWQNLNGVPIPTLEAFIRPFGKD